MTNQAATEARRAYMRQWRRNNPDKVRAQQERYWAKKGEELVREVSKHEQQAQGQRR